MSIFRVTETTPTPQPEIEAALADPGFGRYFADYAAKAVWTKDVGWHDHEISRLENTCVHPGLAALHYGQEIFEGLKAYRHDDDSLWLFRPDMNAARFARSATRMAMAPLPTEQFIEAVEKTVAYNPDWVPAPAGEQSMYLRPFLYASETLIGVRDSYEYTFMTIASPAGPYYADPLRLWVTPTFSRSMIGGTGEAKCGGNYATAMAAEAEAREHGCDQVLWLDSATRTHVEEGGTMNFMAITAAGELVTPALTGTILPGVTRDSLLRIAPAHGLTPVERTLTITELLDGIESGAITETFSCGTAAVVSPVTAIVTPEREVVVANGEPGSMTQVLRSHLTGIQYGTEDDTFGWLHPVSAVN